MNRVRETGAEYIVTKHGRPVARLVPYVSAVRQSFFGSMKGTVLAYDRPFNPIEGEYQIDALVDAPIGSRTTSTPARRRRRSAGAAGRAQRSGRSVS
jgi:antitoxin (DNA-binding transcriptional repressor) of toxin-antitoxin stability system